MRAEYQTKSEDREIKRKTQKVWRRQTWRHRKREGKLRLHGEEAPLCENVSGSVPDGWWSCVSENTLQCHRSAVRSSFLSPTERSFLILSGREGWREGQGEDRQVPRHWHGLKCRAISEASEEASIKCERKWTKGASPHSQTLKENRTPLDPAGATWLRTHSLIKITCMTHTTLKTNARWQEIYPAPYIGWLLWTIWCDCEANGRHTEALLALQSTWQHAMWPSLWWAPCNGQSSYCSHGIGHKILTASPAL